MALRTTRSLKFDIFPICIVFIDIHCSHSCIVLLEEAPLGAWELEYTERS